MSELVSVKVSKRNQIAVPALARETLNIHSGDRLLVDIQDGLLVLIPQPLSYAATLKGLHKEIWERIDGQEYVYKERQAWDESA